MAQLLLRAGDTTQRRRGGWADGRRGGPGPGCTEPAAPSHQLHNPGAGAGAVRGGAARAGAAPPWGHFFPFERLWCGRYKSGATYGAERLSEAASSDLLFPARENGNQFDDMRGACGVHGTNRPKQSSASR